MPRPALSYIQTALSSSSVGTDGRKMRERFLYTVILTVYSTSTLTLTDCNQEEFKEIRQTYEDCANDKIANITELLQNGDLGNSQDMVICEQVKQLINHCGDLLYRCFHLDQV